MPARPRARRSEPSPLHRAAPLGASVVWMLRDPPEPRSLNAVPMARLGETDDIVGAAIWLASDASAYVTGANVAIDGGLALGRPPLPCT